MAAQLPDSMVTLAAGTQQPLPSLVSSRRLRWQKIARALRLWVPAGILILQALGDRLGTTVMVGRGGIREGMLLKAEGS